jgi:DNA modification methylase
LKYKAYLYPGDVLVRLAQLPDAFFDSIVTDPPYELGFMGKSWDSSGIAYSIPLWKELLRVLKPGGFLLSFGGTRTYHRMACAIEDAGFEIRDQIQWIYGSGFPKALDVSKAIDKAACAERSVIGPAPYKRGKTTQKYTESRKVSYDYPPHPITAPSTEDAKKWDGWATALKPAHEPICVARKPLIGTVVENVLAHGTGALNIDACRIELNGDYKAKPNGRPSLTGLGDNYDPQKANQADNVGRWPANVILDEEAGALLNEQSGTLTSGKCPDGFRGTYKAEVFGMYKEGYINPETIYADSGGASRFFYCAKASKKEREGSKHPTIKPLKLMRYLVKLVTSPGGIILDPFCGSGTTLAAGIKEDFYVAGIDREAEYIEDSLRRLKKLLEEGEIKIKSVK